MAVPYGHTEVDAVAGRGGGGSRAGELKVTEHCLRGQWGSHSTLTHKTSPAPCPPPLPPKLELNRTSKQVIQKALSWTPVVVHGVQGTGMRGVRHTTQPSVPNLGFEPTTSWRLSWSGLSTVHAEPISDQQPAI